MYASPVLFSLIKKLCFSNTHALHDSILLCECRSVELHYLVWEVLVQAVNKNQYGIQNLLSLTITIINARKMNIYIDHL